MNAEAQQGMNSVAVEIPVEARAFFHTLLPVTDGRYRNAGVEVKIDGLVPLGPQEGELVAHLGGVFSSGCSKEQIKALLAEQALDQQFMTMARQVKGFDYRGTILAKATYRAKEKLGL
jgi:hypothetical protein